MYHRLSCSLASSSCVSSRKKTSLRLSLRSVRPRGEGQVHPGIPSQDRNDRYTKLCLIVVGKGIHRFARYRRRIEVLPASWKYISATASFGTGGRSTQKCDPNVSVRRIEPSFRKGGDSSLSGIPSVCRVSNIPFREYRAICFRESLGRNEPTSQLCQKNHVLDRVVKMIISKVMDPVSQMTCDLPLGRIRAFPFGKERIRFRGSLEMYLKFPFGNLRNPPREWHVRTNRYAGSVLYHAHQT